MRGARSKSMKGETKLVAYEIYWRLGNTHLAATLAINLVVRRTIFSGGRDTTFWVVVRGLLRRRLIEAYAKR